MLTISLLARIGIGLSVLVSIGIIFFSMYVFIVQVEQVNRISHLKGKVFYYMGAIFTTIMTILGTAILSYSIGKVLTEVLL